tara:strand:- start:963 stop:1349 length:387 start_codon:yes stop_codon:yes gene_type:complete
MSSIETISAPCPHCQQPMLQKLETNSSHSFMYDACFSCGYATGEAMGKELSSRALWKTLLAHHGYTSINAMSMGMELHDNDGNLHPLLKEPIYVPREDVSQDITDIHENLISEDDFEPHLKQKTKSSL